MVQVRIDLISGATYPVLVSVADVYGNYETQIYTITGGTVPPTVTLNNSVSGVTIPAIFNSAPQIMLILTDANNCRKFHILDCTFGCAFAITVDLGTCTVDITVTAEP